jgi:rare lipoprotein A
LPETTVVPDVSAIPDAVPRVEPRSTRGNPASYEVAGRRYVVLASAEGVVERGIASWYGPTFHGKNTSSGEVYDMYAMTAAHKTLPIPCYARVTNFSNGRSVIVRVNDRGPFIAGRIVDLSYTAAARLDVLRTGTAFVELEVLTPGSASKGDWPLGVQAAKAPSTPSQTPPGANTAGATTSVAASGIYVQVGAFGNPNNARRLQQQLLSAGIAKVALLPSTDASSLTRVRVGPLTSVADYDALQSRLATLDIRDAVIVRE